MGSSSGRQASFGCSSRSVRPTFPTLFLSVSPVGASSSGPRCEPWEHGQVKRVSPGRGDRFSLSVQEKTRVVGDPVLLQEGYQLLLKSRFLMMLFLISNIRSYRLHPRLAHTESGIPGLPREARPLRPALVDSPRRICFHFLHQLGQPQGRRLDEQQVNMVARAVGQQGLAIQLRDDATQVRKQFRPELRVQIRTAVLGAEQGMNHDVAECVGHGCRPFQGFRAFV